MSLAIGIILASAGVDVLALVSVWALCRAASQN